MHQDIVKFCATKKWLELQNARVRINVPPSVNHENVILAFFGNICVSLLSKLVFSIFKIEDFEKIIISEQIHEN